jgi:hypothetical protein
LSSATRDQREHVIGVVYTRARFLLPFPQ